MATTNRMDKDKENDQRKKHGDEGVKKYGKELTLAEEKVTTMISTRLQ